jgi:hypothetical protein
MFPLKKKVVVACGFVVLVGGTLLVAQWGQRQRPQPNHDALVAYLGLNETQVSCLQTNRAGFRNAVSPLQQQLGDLMKQMRQAARDGADTSSIKSQIDLVHSSIQSLRSQYVSSAQACVAGNPKLGNLIAAASLMNEVRQAMGLLLVEPTGGPGLGFGGNRFPAGRRGPGGR